MVGSRRPNNVSDFLYKVDETLGLPRDENEKKRIFLIMLSISTRETNSTGESQRRLFWL